MSELCDNLKTKHYFWC